jgi:hypothetical protein
MKKSFLLLLVSVYTMEAFRLAWMHSFSRRSSQIQARRTPPSDDIFDVGSFSPRSSAAKRQYLQEDWQFTPQENVVLEPFREKMSALRQDEDMQDADIVDDIPSEDVEKDEIPNASMFAVIYKFKHEFLDSDMDESIKAHKEYCQLFSYIVSDEVLRASGHRGAVSIWVGTPDEDESILRQEIDKFVSADPFMNEGKVDEWEVLDISPSIKKELSLEEQKQYDELLAERRQELIKLLEDNDTTV